MTAILFMSSCLGMPFFWYTHITNFSFAAGGLIDRAHHKTKAHLALAETVELQNAVHLAVENTDVSDTLTVVTADHSHTMTIGGYPNVNTSILGKHGWNYGQ